MKIGEKIRIARKQKGYTQYELADKLGISRSTIANYEIARRIPDFKDLQTLSTVLGVTVEYFADNQMENTLHDFITRADAIFNSDDISVADKEKTFNYIMKIYVNRKEL